MILLLLKFKIIMFFNSLFKNKLSKKRGKFLAIAGGSFLFYIIFQWAYEIFNVLIQNESNGYLIANNFLCIIFFIFFIFLFISGITISIHYLFVSSDLQLLMAAPITTTTIFSFKLIESICANSSFFIFLGMPIFIAYGIVLQAYWSYFPFMLITILLFLVLPAISSFLIAILVVRIIPASKAKELMAGLLGLITLGIWITLQVFKASQFQTGSSDYNPDRINQIGLLAKNAYLEKFPSTWAAKSLIAFASDDLMLVITQFIPLLFITILLFLICLMLSKKLFRDGLISSSSVISIKNKTAKQQSKNIINIKFDKLFSSVIGTIYIRDFKILIRDIRQITHVLILIAMMIVFPIIQSAKDMNSTDDEFLPFIFIIIFSSIVSSQISSRLIPLEGKSFWLMKLVPQSWKKILFGKFFVGFTFNLIAVWIAVIISCFYFQTSLRVTILAFTITFLISFAISIYGITIGSLYPKFDWEHPKRMLSTGGGLIALYGALLLAGIWLGIIALIYSVGPYVYNNILLLDLINIIISIIITIIITTVGITISSRKLARYDWVY